MTTAQIQHISESFYQDPATSPSLLMSHLHKYMHIYGYCGLLC